MLDKAKAPTAMARGRGLGDEHDACADNSTSRRPKRNLGNVWLEQGRYLFRSGPNGSTVFDTWKWIGEPLPRRRRA